MSWIIAFVGACMLKVLNGAWWVMMYELLIIVGQMVMILSESVEHYRITVNRLYMIHKVLLIPNKMIALLTTSIPLLTIQIDYVLQYTNRSNIPKGPTNTYVVGYIVLVIVQVSKRMNGVSRFLIIL